MMAKQLLEVKEYCSYYNIPQDFIISLENSGVIDLTVVGQNKFIHEDQFSELERYVHFYYDLNINIEGIDALKNLLNKVNLLQEKVDELENNFIFMNAIQASNL